MKRSLLLSLLLPLALLFSTCGGIDMFKSNQFTYQGKTYKIAHAKAILQAYPGQPDIVMNSIVLYTDGLVFQDSINDFTGQGDGMLFTLLSHTELWPITYTISPNIEHQAISMAGVFLGYDAASSTADTEMNMSSGEVSLLEKNDTYTFEISFTDSLGNELEAWYKGALDITSYLP